MVFVSDWNVVRFGNGWTVKMASTYTILQLKNDLEAILHGTTLNDIQNPTDIINRAARDVLADLDPMETRRISTFAPGLYDTDSGVYNYLIPADLKLNKVIDIRPQVNRFAGNNPIQHSAKEFDLYKAISSISIDNDTGLKFIRISVATFPPFIFNDFENTTGSNGTNVADGAIITNLAQDRLFKIHGSASLSFNISGTGTGTITNSTLASTDLSTNNWVGVASAFIWIFIPAGPTNLTSVSLKWGSDASNFWSQTATTNYWSQTFVTGWNLLNFPWPTAKTGNPDASKLTYMQASLVWAGGAQNTFRIDKMFFALPTIYEMVYYSKFIFQNSAGSWQENTSADTDLVNLDTDSYNILLYKCAELAGLQLQQAIPLRGKLLNFDFETYGGLYDAAVKRYRENYKNESLKVIGNYYRNRYTRNR